MTYEELHRRYGSFVSDRVRHELTESEFKTLNIEALPQCLEAKAECAHENYVHLMNNPKLAPMNDFSSAGEACRRWREVEDLAYTLVIEEDVSLARVA